MTDRVLVVEDADTLREVVSTLLESEGYIVDSFPTAELAIPALKINSYACILADFKLPGKNGIEFLKDAREVTKSTPFIIMTAYGSINIAIEAMKNGANDFLCKPFEPSTLATVIKDVIKHRRILERNLGISQRRERTFISQNQKIQGILHHAKKVARVDSSVLILGESGTGKELVARFIHEHSPRHDKPFVAVNCAAIPEELLESDLFGHEAGSFTGATQTRTGLFELASEGTIFLDEIGDMPPALQVKLLRALQEHEIKRVGANKTIKVNPRIITATNINIEEALKCGKMREDFYFRIAVMTLSIPPLRERPEDIKLLTDYYIDYFCTKLGRETLKIDEAASEVLKKYRWPGNARELENVMERAVILADTNIRPNHLGIELNVDINAIDEAAISLTEIAQHAAQKAETEAINRVLAQTKGNKSQAARILGVSYKTLLNKIKDYKLEPASQVLEEDIRE